MTNGLIGVGLMILAGWVVYMATRPGGVFVVRVRGGVPRATRGVVTSAFLRDVAEICAQHRVRSGTVRGVADGRRIRLEFSSGMPTACRQQIRNVWEASGWSVR